MSSRKNTLYAATFLMEICYGLFLLVGGIIAAQVIGSPFLLGLTGTLHVGVRVAANVAFGHLSDRVGRKRLMLLACLLICSSFGALYMNSVSTIFLAYLLAGVGTAIFWPLMEAWIGLGSDSERLIRSSAIFGVIFTAGIAAGSFTGGFFMKIAVEASLALGCLAAFPPAVLIAVSREERASGSPPTRQEASGSDVRGRFFIYIGWIANFGTWTTIGILRFLFPKLGLGLGLSSASIGNVNGVLYLSWALCFFVLSRYRSWAYRLGPLAAFQILGVMAALTLWIVPSIGTFFASFVMLGFSAGMTYLSSMFYGQNGASDRGTKSGLHEMVLGLGMLIGPLFGGALAEKFSMSTPFLFAAVVIAICITAECLFLARARGQDAARQPAVSLSK